MRFIHTADWQLGKPFGRFDPETRTALSEARFDAIDTIGKEAARHNVEHVLVAGDIFDTECPDERTIVQAVTRMQRYACKWWLLPGNHDFARNGGLWDRVRRRSAPNIFILADPQPHEIASETWILPAPLLHRHTLDDPTEAFGSMNTPGARIRIGVAHGSIRDFGSQGDAKNLIAADRARLSGLDYLALGDWHGTLQVDERTWYSGTPETDRFQRDDPGHCLLVEVEAGAPPRTTPIRTGRFQWTMQDWVVNDATAFEAECGTFMNGCDPAVTLIQLKVAGIGSLVDRTAITRRIEDDLRHSLRYLDVRDGDLVSRPSDTDLEGLQTEGMLGHVAASLREEIEAGGGDSALARRALEKLFVEIARGEA